MEVKDLMIGDWVQVPSELHRYKRIRSTFDMDSAVLYKPIPLTSEILEKNGFRYDGGIFYCDNEDDNYQMDIHPKETNYTGKYTFICIEKGCITLTELPITYVHQLQHALKLCEITKEIEL